MSFESRNYPGDFLRHYNNTLYVAGNGGDNAWDSSTSWTDDVSCTLAQPSAP